MDEKDEKILNILKENSKLSSQQISKKTLIPITTVHHRIKKLEKEGIIKKYTVILDNKKIGRPVSAYILINVGYKVLRRLKITPNDIMNKLKRHELVDEATVIAGSIDILIKVRVKDIDELNQFSIERLKNIEGVERTQTMVIMDEV